MFSLTFSATFLSYMLLAFLTNVAGFSTVAAASIYSASTLIKVAATLCSGIIVDGINWKSGKFRTWTLIGGFLMLASSVMFLNFGMSEGAYTVVFLILFFINQLAYQFEWVGGRSLVGPLSKNSADGISLTTAAQIGTMGAGIIYGLISTGLLAAFAASKQPYFMPMFIYCLIGLLGAVLLFAMSKNYDKPVEANPAAPKADKVSIIDMFKSLKGQGMIFFIASIFGNTQSGFFATLLFYFTTYVLQNAYITGLAVTCNSIGGFVGAFMAPAVCAKFSKKTVYQWAHYISAVLYFLIFLLGRSTVLFLIIRTTLGFVGTFAGVTLPALGNDLADYNEMKNISHARGFTQAVIGLSIRIGIVISGIISSYGLAAVGFSAAGEMTDKIATGIMALMGIGPAIVCVICGVLISFYKIDEKELDAYRLEKAAKNN